MSCAHCCPHPGRQPSPFPPRQDYLLAPMPFLVGVPAAKQFTALRSIPLEEVMLVDLDAGTCTPGCDLPPATPSSLPYAEELSDALQVRGIACCSWEVDFMSRHGAGGEQNSVLVGSDVTAGTWIAGQALMSCGQTSAQPQGAVATRPKIRQSPISSRAAAPVRAARFCLDTSVHPEGRQQGLPDHRPMHTRSVVRQHSSSAFRLGECIQPKASCCQ